MKKKPNAPDATLRNVRAAAARDKKLEDRLHALTQQMQALMSAPPATLTLSQGTQFAFKNVQSGKLVSSWDEPHTLIANRDAIGPGETFELIVLNAPPDPTPVPPEPTPEPPIPDAPTVIAGDASVLDWPQTATLAHLGIRSDALVLNVTGQSWPEVVIEEAPAPNQAGTLWICMAVDGVWYASGVERLRGSQLQGSKPETLPSQWVGESFHDSNIWGPLAHQNPQPGDEVGMFVAAGDTRAGALNAPVHERSNTVWFLWPDDSGADPVQPA